jgi:folate-binding protein YgfZ
MATAQTSHRTMTEGITTPAYEAAMSGASVLRRRDRRFFSVVGKAPGEMLKGILSGRIPARLGEYGGGWKRGEAHYSAILTPKGKMVTDLRILPGPESGFLLDFPLSGVAGALAHFKKYLNPRFAQLGDRSGELGMLTVVGPGWAEMVSGVLGFELETPEPGTVRIRPGGKGSDLALLHNADILPPAMDLLLPTGVLEQVRGRLEELGARPMDSVTWHILRIEAGTPLFGVDMTEDTIPVEAGIQDRAIDHQKGCYTGQEVIVRIRDRGQVNKQLRRILLGEAEIPGPGTELFLAEGEAGEPKAGPQEEEAEGTSDPASGPPPPGRGRKVGWITSSCRSPRFGQTIALGYVKRRVAVGGEVRLGGPEGPPGWVDVLA